MLSSLPWELPSTAARMLAILIGGSFRFRVFSCMTHFSSPLLFSLPLSLSPSPFLSLSLSLSPSLLLSLTLPLRSPLPDSTCANGPQTEYPHLACSDWETTVPTTTRGSPPPPGHHRAHATNPRAGQSAADAEPAAIHASAPAPAARVPHEPAVPADDWAWVTADMLDDAEWILSALKSGETFDW